MQLPSNVWNVIDSDWQKLPLHVRDYHSLNAENLFKIFLRGCQLFREGKVDQPAKIFADNENKESRLDKYLPLENETFLGYDRRMTKSYGHNTYLVYVFDMSPYDKEFSQSLQDLRENLCNQAKQTEEWGPIVAELFFGRYQTTVGGIHKERCATLHYVLHGNKVIRTWPENTWDVDKERVRYSSDERTGQAEHYLLDAQFHYKSSSSTDLNGSVGDLFYWPEGWWHVGSSKGLTCALTVALHPKPTHLRNAENG